MSLPPASQIRVYDDASPTLNVGALADEAGLQASIHRGAQRRGASGMIRLIWKDFLTSAHAHLLFLDSDMIANTDALAIGLERLARVDGLLSLYNSRMHEGVESAPDLLSKSRLGNAGTLWTRDMVRLALAEVHLEPGGDTNLDNRYSQWFAAKGVPMWSLRRSRVQHLGISGENNQYFGRLEHGMGFVPDSARQFEAIADTYDQLLANQRDYLEPRRGLRLLAWRLRTALGRQQA